VRVSGESSTAIVVPECPAACPRTLQLRLLRQAGVVAPTKGRGVAPYDTPRPLIGRWRVCVSLGEIKLDIGARSSNGAFQT
jgi:hypothetical protein